MIWADPSANPVLSLAGGLPRPRRQLPASRQRPVGKVARGRRSCRAAARRSRSRPGRSAGCTRRPSCRCRRATASSSSSTARPATATRSGATRERVARRRRRRQGRPRVGRAPLRRGAGRTAVDAAGDRGAAGGDPRGAAGRCGRLRDGSASARSSPARSCVPGAAGGVDVAEHDGVRRLGLLGVRRAPRPDHARTSSVRSPVPPAPAADRRRPALPRSDGVLRRRRSCCASTPARAAPRCSRRSSAWPTTSPESDRLQLCVSLQGKRDRRDGCWKPVGCARRAHRPIIQRGDNLTIRADLVDVRDNKQLWGEQYERKISDPPPQREITREISTSLRQAFGR